jgi:hypothetical protein
VLKDFGFVIPGTEVSELVLSFPIDVTSPRHPSHVVFSTASTVDEFYASAEETFLAFVTVRAPFRHPHGLMNPMHETSVLRFFHPKLVSMVSFEVATLIERTALRNSPDEIPSARNRIATVQFLLSHLKKMEKAIVETNARVGDPAGNYRKIQAKLYREEQLTILQDVIGRMETVY